MAQIADCLRYNPVKIKKQYFAVKQVLKSYRNFIEHLIVYLLRTYSFSVQWQYKATMWYVTKVRRFSIKNKLWSEYTLQ